MSFTGVFPVYNTTIKVNTAGKTGTDTTMVTIADTESITVKIDGTVEDWTPLTTSGWKRQLMTGKSLSITCKGKRNYGDPGNDYIADTAWKDGLDCTTHAEMVFPDGGKLAFDCVIDVTSVIGDDSTKVAPLEFELKCDGKPIFTAGTV